MGLLGTIGSIGGAIAGSFVGNPALGATIGGTIGGALDSGNQQQEQNQVNQEQQAQFEKLIEEAKQAGLSEQEGYTRAINIIQQQQSSNQSLLNQPYQESAGLKAQTQLLNQGLSARGMSTSPSSFGTGYAPLVAADYNNSFNRQYNIANLGMSMADKLSGLYTQQGTTQANLAVGLAGMGQQNLQFLYSNKGSTSQSDYTSGQKWADIFNKLYQTNTNNQVTTEPIRTGSIPMNQSQFVTPNVLSSQRRIF
jgi:hypothetical protein